MRKGDLVVGEHYALGSTSRFDRLKGVEAVVLEVDKSGITVELCQDAASAYGLGISYQDRSKGSRHMLPNASVIREPWAQYAERLAEHESRQRETERKRERARRAAREVEARLDELGFYDRQHFRINTATYSFTFEAEALQRALRAVAERGA